MWNTLWNTGLPTVQWGAAVGASLAGAVFDIAYRKIPNALTVAVLAGGLAWSGFAVGWAGLLDSFLGCLLAAFPFVLLFVFAGGGAGDAKLMGAIGSWLGIIGSLAVLAAVAASGIVWALVFAARRRQVSAAVGRVRVAIGWLLVRIVSRDRAVPRPADLPEAAALQKFPYGVAILCGVCIAAMGAYLWQGR